jgi:glutamate synthase (NADPH/NADH) small chain
MSTSGSANTFSKYTWREIARQDLPRRQPDDRVADSLEIYGLFDEQTAREQANRCIQCPNPGCVGGCPLCNPIPQWMSLTAEGRFVEAAATLGSLTNMADICARLCPRERLCEETCILNGSSQPVAIAALEQFLADYALQHGLAEIATPPPNGFCVAVVGSGPGGLACADYLAKLGFAVTVFEVASEPGGSLLAGVPGFKVEKEVVQRRLRILEKLGVTFRVDAIPGANVVLEKLRSDFDAVYLCFDARAPRNLALTGADLKGVVPAAEFIRLCNSPRQDQVRGKKVVVIGGGESAMDAARTAVRNGAGGVTCVYRRNQAQMPCAPHDYEAACEEGVRFIFAAAPLAILPDQAGGVSAVRFARTELGPPDATGRPAFALVPGAQLDVPADLVVAAIGYEPGTTHLPGDFADLAVNARGTLLVDSSQMTNLPGVYAGGDLVQGPCMALLAVRDARRAAAAIQARFCRTPTPRS